ncbi:protein Wnt-6-like isoform X2 [Branchiostoma lanceolatum]|uniref:protein Wnt-6-like isoform X2 n=1 Tax=Branchiostoma lanceolatum TaxID=7740 RepID=UPI0034513753
MLFFLFTGGDNRSVYLGARSLRSGWIWRWIAGWGVHSAARTDSPILVRQSAARRYRAAPRDSMRLCEGIHFLVLWVQISHPLHLVSASRLPFSPPTDCRAETLNQISHRAVGSPLVLDHRSICRKTRRLIGKQAEICRKEPEIVQEVVKGAKLGTGECQFQFKERRWNCSTADKFFGRILTQDIRETAFVYAVTSAGVTFAVTQSCSMGELLQCGCDYQMKGESPDGSWEWGGCGDDIDFGYTKSREFMDAQTRHRSDIRTLLTLHNNEAGRLAVKNFMRTECKCHGLSGSCAVKTCWKKMPIFREVGVRLKERFNGAFQVMGSNNGKYLIPVGDTIKAPTAEDLVYTNESPNFCKRNRKTGSQGTKGRACNATSMGIGGCDLLCCGRGYKERQVVVEENCKCRFHWCCVVKCSKCTAVKTVHECL